MALIHPFKAWRPKTDAVEEVACVPYDVIDTDEAHELAEGKPNSFLHVIRPEIDLPDGTAYNDDAVYEKGAENLQKLLESDVFKQDEEPSLYIYQLVFEGRVQTGLFTCVSVEDYDNDVILKHELTRPAKEDDRTRHVVDQQAHAEPVMLTFKDQQDITALARQVTDNEDPLFDFVASDGVQHTIWKVEQPDEFVQRFANIDHLYVADGHHRCKAASRAAEQMRQGNDDHTGEEEYNFFPAVVFSMDQMHIMSYNRIIFNIPDGFFEQLGERVELTPDADPTPQEKGRVSIYYDGTWYGAALPVVDAPNSVEKLDVARLQNHILEPLLDISDPRRDENIDFVGGIRGTDELEERVDSGEADLAISMYPTDIRELVEVSDEGRLMPPKSTWFEPKLRSGMLVHTF